MSQLTKLLNRLLDEKELTQAELVRRTKANGNHVTKGTVSKYFSEAPTRPQKRVLRAFADVLEVSVEDLEAAANFTGREPFVPDPVSDQLTAPQRAVVNEVIRQFADANQGAGDGDEREATSHTDAGGTPVTGEDDGGGENVHYLVPPPPAETTAAYRGRNRGRELREQQDADAEGSQVTEDDEE